MHSRSERRLSARPTAPLLVPTPSTPVGVKEVSTEEILEACLRREIGRDRARLGEAARGRARSGEAGRGRARSGGGRARLSEIERDRASSWEGVLAVSEEQEHDAAHPPLGDAHLRAQGGGEEVQPLAGGGEEQVRARRACLLQPMNI